MFKITCLGQGSSGNCWILDYNGELLIVDAGLQLKTIKRGIDYNLVAVQGVLISHIHKDHSMAVKDLKKCGLSVFTPFTVSQKSKTFGHYRIQAFSVPHNGCECYGFYIKVGEHRLIYATDLEYLPFTFKKQELTGMIIECNYQTKYLDMDAENIEHKVIGHCELETAIGIVKANMTDKLQNVIITHLGVGTCDGNECVSEIKKVVSENVNVDYARAGESYILCDA